MAQTWRAVGAAAERLGLRRPSYQHVRRLVRIERRRRQLEARGRAVLGRAAATLAAGACRARSSWWSSCATCGGRRSLCYRNTRRSSRPRYAPRRRPRRDSDERRPHACA